MSIDMNKIVDELIDYPYNVRQYLDHLNFLSWYNYMAHRCSQTPMEGTPLIVVNFDGREYIDMPSGAKVRITIKVENITSEVVKNDN